MTSLTSFSFRFWITLLGFSTLVPWTAGCESNSDDPPPQTRATVKDVTMDRLSGVGLLAGDQVSLQMSGGSIRGTIDPPLSADQCTSLIGIALTGHAKGHVSNVSLADLGTASIALLEDAVGTVTGSAMSRPSVSDACSSSHVAVGDHASATVEDSALVNESGAGVAVGSSTAGLTFRRSTIKKPS
ncbi:hypothetical protein LZC95_32375 [Pendulispora brunnea]|uniref:Uncharacterized protein n=1 Tax=Pendulispora brunnea TaxID=2905690 RepID=A0ABZ2JXD6_9BACT